jgi:hypothetical protein
MYPKSDRNESAHDFTALRRGVMSDWLASVAESRQNEDSHGNGIFRFDVGLTSAVSTTSKTVARSFQDSDG